MTLAGMKGQAGSNTQFIGGLQNLFTGTYHSLGKGGHYAHAHRYHIIPSFHFFLRESSSIEVTASVTELACSSRSPLALPAS